VTGRSPERDDLVQRFIDGDAQAHRTVSAWAHETVRYRAWRMSREEREDVVQQAVIDAWRAASQESFAVRVGLKAMVRNIAARRCVDWLRRRRTYADVPPDLPDPTKTTHDEDAAVRARVHAILLDLRPACRDLLRMHYLEDLTYQDIARRTDRAVGTIKARVFGCMREIHRRMTQCSDSAPSS
jgi:RNA polymerase sigma factor (sigma-70 family)